MQHFYADDVLIDIYVLDVIMEDRMPVDLTQHEQILLLSIWRLQSNAYGVLIRQNVEEVSRRQLHYGTLYNTLDKLTKRGLVESRRGEPTAECGGRHKIYYQLTREGLAALQKAKDLQSAIWDGIPDFVQDSI